MFQIEISIWTPNLFCFLLSTNGAFKKVKISVLDFGCFWQFVTSTAGSFMPKCRKLCDFVLL